MSINHFSSELPETLWWAQHQKQHQQQQHQLFMEPQPASSEPHKALLNHIPESDAFWGSQLYRPHQEATSAYRSRSHALKFNLNENDEDEEEEDEGVVEGRAAGTAGDPDRHDEEDRELDKEPLFEKPLTPSDVGKLNRLVIPKQHAERYFPLSGESTDKGLHLTFEDETGRSWRFRYSYWNSSQSYVLTKGWSRYVKDKNLDAGDVVLFERHRTDCDRLYIRWRRRGAGGGGSGGAASQPACAGASGSDSAGGGDSGWSRLLCAGRYPYPTHHGHGPPAPYQPDFIHAGSAARQHQTPATGNSRTVRLFGVNLECHVEESEPLTPDGSSSSSQAQPYRHYSSHAYYPLNHMDLTFYGDLNVMRNHQG